MSTGLTIPISTRPSSLSTLAHLIDTDAILYHADPCTVEQNRTYVRVIVCQNPAHPGVFVLPCGFGVKQVMERWIDAIDLDPPRRVARQCERNDARTRRSA